MGNGSLRFKDNSGNVISFISGSGTDIVISGGTLNLLGMTEVALGNVTISGSTLVNGTQGNQGPQGMNGFQGPTGLQGTTGSNGAQGNQGPTGLQGTTGAQGNQGPTGLQGNQGPTGLQGFQGTQGTQGTTGASAGITSYTNPADNRVLTSVSSTSINAEANLTFDGTNLGIGTTDPISALHILGNQFRIEDNDPTITLKRNVASAFGGHIDWLTNDNTLGFQIANNALVSAAVLEFNHSGVNRMVIKSDGNVGIGTTSPIEKFTLKGTSVNLALQADASSQNLAIKWYNSADTAISSILSNTGIGDIIINPYLASNALIVKASTGNVGIGTTTPNSLLHISGSNDDSSSVYFSQLRINGTGTYPNNIAGLSFENSGVQQHIRFIQNGVTKFQMRYNEGNGIDNKLKYYSFITNSDFVTFDANNNNVGIGTTSPTSKLTVVGDIKATTLTLTNSKTRQNFANNPFVPLGKPRVLDLSATNAGLKGFAGGFTDGRYGYFVPLYNGAYHGLVARVDLNDFSSVTFLDLSATNAGLKGFIGGFTDGRYGYFVPYYNGAAHHGLVARIQLFNGGNL